MLGLVLGVSPFGEPHTRLVASVGRAGGCGVLDLGAGDRRAREALALAHSWCQQPFAVRITAGCAVTPDELFSAGRTGLRAVLLGAGCRWRPADLPAEMSVLVEVATSADAAGAVADGAHGLIARGTECGGPVGELSTFVLLQQLLADDAVTVPVWAWGGIGERTAAAAVIGGAAGVVLDSQLALLAEAQLEGWPSEKWRRAIASMDGSETIVVDGQRVWQRRGRGALPIGQDGFLAARFARRFGDVGGAVRGIRAAIHDAVSQQTEGLAASALSSDAHGSGWLGVPLPIAQGPMTRVSDQPSFAAAAAADGALPFVALALATAEQSRTLLEQTRAELVGRPWGVGILGFAPEETRYAQLEVIRQLQPSHAIIAGGRPAQAIALEEAGISTFLHVPSPELCKQFLQAGARKFVFEGSECGGHVGPLHSFPLWEAQVGVLADYLDTAAAGTARQLQVLFAGGVNDQRSAAMVAVMAAPLIESGVNVGVLMGTAYLFTEEAVRCGAIGEVFQRQAVAARRTELLVTAPGHATRCLPTPFTESYARIKSELQGSGVSGRQLWERLEQLNIGRLRMASKGVERIGEDLVTLDEARQLADGMFMAGEVAVLRSAVTTTAQLHAAVSSGAAEFLAERAEQLRTELGAATAPATEPPPRPLDVAVVGMSCMFPQASDLAGFWANVLSGVDSVTEVPPHRWDPGIYYSAVGEPNTSTSKWGGFLPQIPFDPLRYGIPPASLQSIEPVQLLALEVASRALIDAGYRDRDFNRARTSVVFGAEAGSDLSNATVLRTTLPAYLGTLPDELDEQLPELTEDSFPGMLANVIAGRVANRLDLGGANYTVDAACASSLAAVDVACKELTSHTSDVVLCGGADLHNGINDYLLFSSVHALSPTGRTRTFDAAADGIVLGEGVACLVLKRLADAEADGDRIYAVISGVGSASDGRSLGLTAPRPEGQRAALQRAYRIAGVSPSEVTLIEAHGTGTVVGDRTELSTLTEVFTEAGAAPGSCTLGSVKSQIGHTKCAAGLAGLIKTVLALHTGVLPPTSNLDTPNPAWDPEKSPFCFHTSARPWAVDPARRVAGVSGFGFGGTNFHVVLRGYDTGPPPRHGLAQWPVELFIFRGAGPAAARGEIETLLKLVSANEAAGRPWRLRDLAATTSRRAEQRAEPVQCAVLAGDLDELLGLLGKAAGGQHDPGAGVYCAGPAPPGPGRLDPPGKVAMLFPGQGSQRPGMFAELFITFPELQRYLQLGVRVADVRTADVLYPPKAFDLAERNRQLARITDTRVAQPTLGIVGLAAHDVLRRAGVWPDMVAGHSYGELVALAAAGTLDPETLLRLSAARAAAILSAAGDEPGAMAAVSAGPAEIEPELRTAGLADRVVLANHNAPAQTVISGPSAAVADAVARFRAAGLGAKQIPVACAFHSPVVADAADTFATVLANQALHAPELPVFANRTAARYPCHSEGIRAELAAQLAAPVRFAEQVEAMYAAGARIFIEAGPGSVLSKLVSETLGQRPHQTITLEASPGDGLRGYLTALAQLAVAGVDVRTDRLFAGREVVDVSSAAVPERPGWTVDGQLVRTADGEIPTGALTPARPLREMLVNHKIAADDLKDERTGGAPVEAMITEFVQAGRDMITAQRDVLLNYLGASAQQAPGQPVPARQTRAQQARIQPVEITPVRGPGAAYSIPGPISSVARSTGAQSLTAAEIARTVVDIIAERTGYPADMISSDFDLETDLSIDSIKRAEIAGKIAGRLDLASPASGGTEGAAGLADAELEDLAKARTVQAITTWLAGKIDRAATEPASEVPMLAQPPTAQPAAPAGSTAPQRMVLREVELLEPARAARELTGTRFLLFATTSADALPEHSVTEQLVIALTDVGAEVDVLDPQHELGAAASGVHGWIHLGALTTSPAPVMPDSFPALKASLAAAPRWLIMASPGTVAGEQADGLRGFFRTVAREYPKMVARLVEVDPTRRAREVADALVTELLTDSQHPVVRSDATSRRGLELVAEPLESLPCAGLEAPDDRAPAAAAMGLDGESVVLLVGGGRGIAAQFAVALAAASRCRIELLGRTPLPVEPEPAEYTAAGDAAALRAVLAARQVGSPAEIKQEIDRILAQRELAATLAEVGESATSVRYHCVDVRDAAAVHRVIKEIYAAHGRLDGVCYAAGLIEDKLLADKDINSFRRVWNTKVVGASALLDAVDGLPNGPGFVVLYGSIAAVLGNRGQGDYAAANEALADLGARWAAAGGDRRALTVHWGPWAPTGTHAGMVTPELAAQYARRGVRLIDPEEGTRCLLHELAWGNRSDRVVIYTASGW
ncbi:MAG: SDR family NAD(P)-dependent oxidoreductase [Pseudonocardiaceae bacterium]